MNALYPVPFDFGGFFFALAVAGVWAFVPGAAFGWILNRLRASV